ARVAVNLRGMERADLRRGDALLTPGRYQPTDLVDVRLRGDPVGTLPPAVTLHAGSAAVTAHVRPPGTDTARLRLSRPLPPLVGAADAAGGGGDPVRGGTPARTRRTGRGAAPPARPPRPGARHRPRRTAARRPRGPGQPGRYPGAARACRARRGAGPRRPRRA